MEALPFVKSSMVVSAVGMFVHIGFSMPTVSAASAIKLLKIEHNDASLNEPFQLSSTACASFPH